MSKYLVSSVTDYNDGCGAFATGKSLFEAGTLQARLVLSDEKLLGTGFLAVCIDDPKLENAICAFPIGKVKTDAGKTLASDKEAKDAFRKAVKAKRLSVEITALNDDVYDIVLSAEDAVAKKPVADAGAEVPKPVEDAAAEAVASGITTAEEAKARIEYMMANRFNTGTMVKVIKYWRTGYKGERPTDYIDPALDKAADAGRNGVVARIVHKAMLGYMCLLRGPKATGKDTAINSIAWLLMLPKAEVVITRQTDAMDIFGSQVTDNSASDALEKIDTRMLANAEVILAKRKMDSASAPLSEAEKEALLTKALFEKLSAQAASVHIVHEVKAIVNCMVHGGIYLIDEFNMGDSNLYSGFINPLGDGSTHEFEVPGYGPVPISDHFILMATQNDGYAGAEDQNEATMSRFRCFVMAQPESVSDILHSAVKGEIKKKNLTCALPDEKCFKAASRFYDACKSMVLGQGSSSFGDAGGVGVTTDQCLNIRGIVSALTCVAQYGADTSLAEELEDAVVNVCSSDERPTIMQALISIVDC